MMKEEGKLWSPYFAGLVLGLVLLATFVIMGRGLGASGAEMRTVTWVVKAISPPHVNHNPYFAKYAGGNKAPLNNWLVFEAIGVLVGGFFSGLLGGRLGFKTQKGPNISVKGRWILAFVGGAIMGFGARLARGCTSGQGLSGGATMVLGSWAFLMAMFVAAYGAAYFFRKQWI